MLGNAIFSVFLVVFSPKHNSNPNFQILTVPLRNEILEALKCNFSIQDEKNINLVQVHQFSY